MNTHSEDILDRLVLAYNINYRVMKEIQANPLTHAEVEPEEVMMNMAELWVEMVEYIPESHSLRILSMLYV